VNAPFTDPVLQQLSALLPAPVIPSTGDVFHDLMSCVIEQQIHYRSTKGIFAKALARAGIERLSVQNFPLLEELALPHLKLAAGKYETMLGVVDYWRSNPLDFSALPDAAVRAELSRLKGIGPWTIDMLLLYTLQRPDVFPVDDFHLKQVMTSLYQLDPARRLKAQLLQVAEGWGDQKSRAVLYLLAWKQQQRGRGPAQP
jgi:DNA-3-methyladenine glycosylase II